MSCRKSPLCVILFSTDKTGYRKGEVKGNFCAKKCGGPASDKGTKRHASGAHHGCVQRRWCKVLCMWVVSVLALGYQGRASVGGEWSYDILLHNKNALFRGHFCFQGSGFNFCFCSALWAGNEKLTLVFGYAQECATAWALKIFVCLAVPKAAPPLFYPRGDGREYAEKLLIFCVSFGKIPGKDTKVYENE